MTDVTNTTIFEPKAMHDLRKRLRRERQARVGILRNPNQPPKPPLRRAPLTGKWLNLRSSRRPATLPSKGALTALSVSTRPEMPRQTVETAEDGRVLAVDVDGLMASVDGLGDIRTPRTPFAAEYRPDIQPQRRATDPGYRGPSRPSALSAQAWLEDLEPPEDQTPEPPKRQRAPRRWIQVLQFGLSMLGGVGLAVITLLILLGPPP